MHRSYLRIKLSKRVFDLLAKGNSVTLVGMPGAGKNFQIGVLDQFLPKNIFLHKILDIGAFSPDKLIERALKSEQSKKVADITNTHVLVVPSIKVLKGNELFQSKIKNVHDANFRKIPILTTAENAEDITCQNYGDIYSSLLENLVFMKPLSTQESVDLANDRLSEPNKKIAEKIAHLSGGSAGIIKSLADNYNKTKKISKHLDRKMHSSVIARIEKILNTYNIHRIIKKHPKKWKDKLIDNKALHIIEIGFFNTKKQKEVFSPLVDDWINNELLVNTQRSNKKHRIESNLSRNEEIIYRLLKKNPNTPLSVETLGSALWKDDEKYSLWAVYKTISRLKGKLNAESSKYQIAVTKGKGYRLETKEE